MHIQLSPTSKCGTFLKSAAIIGGTLFLLAACNSQPSYVEQNSIADFDYRKRHPIVITEAPENFDIPVSGEMRNLNRSLKVAIAAFGQEAGIDGNGFVEVLMPSGSANEAAVRSIAPQIRSALKAGGVDADRIVLRTYPVSDMAASAPLRLSFMRIKGVVRNCGNWPNAMNGGDQNIDYPNLGCASQANLAAMVDNPADLLRPRPLGPRDPERATVIIGLSRKGESTATSYEEGVGAAVSSVAQQ
ncbi:CpaD family pilus assembly protein [Pseudovibrio sp. Tun.PSC04-5.I4]|uniref:CpaD family pilus assembly protein n=1 Tax=Pseudovibrio sp. Tun.PSC04-5.I4 TaxID=1798213 RepID=UPI00088E8256|nr:CpaD family pilus assembly protein [Pseudovibrio sp. Tun.PSC04-5.I4]SDR17836.1 pilus assembly protein CpaD [Pseudovibrio sp. Tun.PSC04-5.I4]